MILAALRSLWSFAKLIPWWAYAAVALIGYHFAAIQVAEHQATEAANAKWEKEIAAQKATYDAQVKALQAKQQDVITKTVVEYRDRVKVVKEKGDEIVKQVPVYVPMGSPLLSSGVRVFHDAAASGDVPDDPVRAIAAADPVETSTLLSTVSTNYTACRADQERLTALQKIVSVLGEKK
jgi:hypothetical protein